MAARSSRSAQAGFAVILLMGGLTISGAGAWRLRLLDRTHQSTDIVYPASPRALQAWIKTLDRTDAGTVSRLADRLLIMTLPQRRDAVVAMGNRAFFSQLDPSGDGQRELRELMLAAIVEALSRAPALGDLWYLAGRLRSQLGGVDAIALRYFELSRLYAPRELDLVLARLEALGPAWPLLSEAARNTVRQDLEVASVVDPSWANALRDFLQRAGAEL